MTYISPMIAFSLRKSVCTKCMYYGITCIYTTFQQSLKLIDTVFQAVYKTIVCLTITFPE